MKLPLLAPSLQALAAALAIAAAPAQAQINLGNMLRNALNPANAQCRSLLEWVRTPQPPGTADAAAAPAPGRRMPAAPIGGAGLDARTSFLLSDEVFAKRFGKTYEQLTLQDFRTFQQQTARFCMQNGEFTPAEWQTVQSLWNEQQQARIVQALQARRQQQEAAQREAASARAELDQLAAELGQGTAQTLTLARLQAIRERSRALLPRAGADAQQAFEAAWQRSTPALVPELLRQRAQEAVAQAHGPEQLPQLLRLRESLAQQGAGLGVSLPADDPALQALERRERELAVAAAAAERRQIDGLPDGLPGLEAGVQWQQRFQSTWSGGRLAPELAAVQEDFRKRREGVLQRSGAILVRAVQQATTISEAQGSVGRYTLPSEASLASVQGMRNAVDERIRLIERNDALGRPTAAGAAQSVAAAPAAPAAGGNPVRPTAAAAPVAASTGPGEPSEEAMYDLVRQKFENAAARVKGLYDQCQGGGSGGNAINAMMCLGINLQNGVTGGAAAQPTRIVKFAKIGCEKSPAHPGYNCEYEIQTDNPMNNQFAKMTGFQVDQAGFGQGRFVRNREGRWLMITGE
ncbi:hypothetical protein SNE35_10785 [Paucibacter sp. R3-3]|uniref:Uncharacterized protein n=1 Tax=Roseateles agri TaxID=3098619 RepID=A0ABU5DFE6_9BURK|nr:hypothetical protein [Paucibacter sp. R3-3]MDY0744997.1 hypothetical protein [Paucibacter sp. R3-3]